MINADNSMILGSLNLEATNFSSCGVGALVKSPRRFGAQLSIQFVVAHIIGLGRVSPSPMIYETSRVSSYDSSSRLRRTLSTRNHLQNQQCPMRTNQHHTNIISVQKNLSQFLWMLSSMGTANVTTSMPLKQDILFRNVFKDHIYTLDAEHFL